MNLQMLQMHVLVEADSPEVLLVLLLAWVVIFGSDNKLVGFFMLSPSPSATDFSPSDFTYSMGGPGSGGLTN